MKNIMKFEIDKTANNIFFLVTTMITIIIMGCIFFTGFHYSQLSLVEKNNAAKGVNDLYWKMAEEYNGEFSDEMIKAVLEEYIHEYQTIPVEKRPFNLFASNIADVFFPKDKDIYVEMNDAIREGKEISIDEVGIYSIKDTDFTSFKTPLKLGNYVPWFNFFKVSGYIFILASMVGIIISSLSFSNDSSKKIDQLLFTTKYGRSKLVKAKICVPVILSMLIYLVMIIISIIVFLIFNHGTSGWEASIQTNFCMNLHSLPLEANNLMIWLMTICFYCVNLLAIIGITVFISSLLKNPVGSLLVSIGVFFLPLGLTYIFKQGMIAELLYLFPINNFDVEKMLSILSSKSIILSGSILSNYFMILVMAVVVFVAACTITYIRTKNKKNIS